MDLQRAIKQLMKRCQAWNRKLFRERKILIISDHNILSIPLKPRLQQVTFFAVALFLIWSFYSNGRFMAYQGIIAKKEIEVMRSNMENQELQQLYESLQGEMQGMNSFLDELKKTTHVDSKEGVTTAPVSDKQSSLKTAAEMKAQMVELQGGVSRKLLQYTAKMEGAIASTGLKLDPLLKRRGLVKMRQLAMRSGAYSEKDGVGGPYVPVSLGNPKQKDSLKQQMDYLMALSKVMAELPFGRPIESHHITSGFGVREDPFTEGHAMHTGVDFQGPYGTPIHATAAGTVISAGRAGGYGNMVEISHGNGITTRYGHMKDILVHEGQKVALGAVIGTQGNTGRSSGTHVHYEVRVDHQPQNPVLFLRAGGHV